MKIRISALNVPVTNLGHGRRLGIWVQGCSIGCRGCVAVDTWATDPRTESTVDEVMRWVEGLDATDLDGVTISGGEPFEQPEALRELLERLRVWRAGTGRDIDLLCYSGRHEHDLIRDHGDILALLDVVIPEPFVRERAATIALRGSDNQRIVPLTDLGRLRYTGEDRLEELTKQRERMQVFIGETGVRLVGIPRRRDIQNFLRRLNDSGISLSRRDDDPEVAPTDADDEPEDGPE